MDEGIQREMENLRRTFGSLQDHESIERFARVWEEIGLKNEHREERRDTMRKHISELLLEMISEEEKLKSKLESNVATCRQELSKLQSDLQLQVECDLENQTLLEKEKYIREQVDSLNKMKHDRLKRLKRLTEMEVALCKSLGEDSQLADTYQNQSVPSEEDLLGFRKRVEFLESVKDQRQVEFRNVRTRALFIWNELETIPDSSDDLGALLYHGDAEKFIFSDENMKKIANFIQELEAYVKSIESRANKLRKKIVSLWQRLDIPADFGESYLEGHQGYKMKVIRELETELDRLTMLKQENLERFIKATRAQLHCVWDQCHYGEIQRREFAPAFRDEFSDDALSAHESELDRMNGFYADNVNIFKMVEKRQKLWDQKMMFESRANDPSRLLNRGGKLLAEQRQERKVMATLPKVEEQLKAMLLQWEKDYGREFLVDDQRYIDTINEQWNAYNESKEQEKLKKLKEKSDATMMELKFGTKLGKSLALTPSKRKAGDPTPNPATKMRKVAPSPLVQATSLPRKAQGRTTPGKNVLGRQAHPRKHLVEKNIAARAKNFAITDESFVSQAEVSLASTGTYNEFQRGLAHKVEKNAAVRSSAVQKQKTPSKRRL